MTDDELLITFYIRQVMYLLQNAKFLFYLHNQCILSNSQKP